MMYLRREDNRQRQYTSRDNPHGAFVEGDGFSKDGPIHGAAKE